MSIEQVIEEWQSKPFEWGTYDCCQFVGACIEDATGDNLAKLVDYGSQRDVVEMMEDAGGLDVIVSTVLGDPVDREPRDGDVVMVECAGDDIVGFVWNGVILIRTMNGLVDWPLNEVKAVWALQ